MRPAQSGKEGFLECFRFIKKAEIGIVGNRQDIGAGGSGIR
jgi:hypothetical protein